MPYDVTPASRFEKALAGTLADPSSREEKALMGQLTDPSNRLEALVNARASGGGTGQQFFEAETTNETGGTLALVFPGAEGVDVSGAGLYICRTTAGTIPASTSVVIDAVFGAVDPADVDLFYLQRSGSTTAYAMGINNSATARAADSDGDKIITVDAGTRLFLGTYKAVLVL